MSELTGGGALTTWMQRLSKGEVLFDQGDRDKKVYILLEGKVEIIQDGQRIHELDAKEAFIGEIAALTDEPRSATVRTMIPSTVAVVPNIAELFERDPVWARKLATVLAIRLRRIEKQLANARDNARDEDPDKTVKVLTGLINSLATGMSPD